MSESEVRLIRGSYALVLAIVWLNVLTSSCLAQEATPAAPQVIQVLRDFATQPINASAPAISPWNWPADLKERAGTLTQQQVVEHEGKRVLKLTVTDQLPWDRVAFYRSLAIGPDLLPPTADAVALQVRLLEGSFTLSVGGPTVYFGHSDVLTEPKTVTVDAAGESQRIVFSLHDNLIRNFRRAGWARHAPVIYYTRWIQEPMGLYVHRGSAGVLLIERVELLNQGRGRSEPRVAPEQVQTLSHIVDFGEDRGELERVFRATFEPVSFDGAPKLARPVWTPPVVSLVQDDGAPGPQRTCLNVEHQGAEEVVFTGLKLSGQADANAILVELCASHPARRGHLATDPRTFDEVAIDWLLFVTPANHPMNWTRLQPPVAWASDKALAFDYYFTPDAMREQPHAFYHLRRTVPNGVWTQVVLPLADFICVFGNGAMQSAMNEQQPPKPELAAALAWLPPFRQRTKPTTFQIRRIQWVRLTGTSDGGPDWRSFPQVDPERVRMEPWGEPGLGEFRQMSSLTEP